MNLKQYAAIVGRESRRARGIMTLFIACIAVGVAAIVIVAGIANSVTRGVVSEGRRLMAADVVVEGRRQAPDELQNITQSFDPTIQRADIAEFVSVILGKQGSTSLAEIKVVEGGYPFYGKLVLEPSGKLADLLNENDVVVAPELLARLRAKVGDTIVLGGAPFRVAGIVTDEPDKLSISFSMGPRLFMSNAGAARTSLLDAGARVTYRTLLKLPDTAGQNQANQLKQRIERDLPNSEYYRTQTFAQAQPALRKGFERIGRYLGLVGLLSLLIGCLGVAQVSRVWLSGRMMDIAILRCLGMTSRQVVGLFLAQMAGLSLLASAVGALAGTAVLFILPSLASDILPVDLLDPWQPMAVARGMFMGLGAAMVAVLPALGGLQKVEPVRVFRADTTPGRHSKIWHVCVFVLVLAAIWFGAWLQVESMERASWFIAGLVAVTLVLWLAAAGVSRLARLLPRDAGGLHLRHGLTHLARPGAATLGAIVAIGLGVSFLFTTWLVQTRLSEQLYTELPADAPSTFFVDVQTGQWEGLEKLLVSMGATGTSSQPIVTARFAAIDGVPVRELLKNTPKPASVSGESDGDESQSQRQSDREGTAGPGRSRRWALSREQRITYGPSLPKGNETIRGKFPSTAADASKGMPTNGVSVEESFAKDINVKLGSLIELDVQGVPVELKVTSLRSVDWRTFGINFFLFAEPGPLDQAPQSRVAVAKLPNDKVSEIQLAVVKAYPNVTLIHIRDVMDKVLNILTSLSLAVRGLGLFTLAAGMIVLGGTIAATQATRSREVALLKTVGMTRRDVMLVFAIEYALTGSVAAIVGIASGTLLGWAMLTQVMDLPWTLPWLAMLIAMFITVLLSVIVGLLASAKALTSKPIEVLRTQ